MYKVDELSLMTGIDIKLKHPAVKIHQPSIKEIASIGGEKILFNSTNALFIDSKPLIEFLHSLEDMPEQEKEILIETVTSFDSLMFLLQVYSGREDEEELEVLLELIETLFSVIIITHDIVFDKESNNLILVSKSESDSILVDRDLFLEIKGVTSQMLLLDKFFGVETTKKKLSEAAQKIADKMAAAEEKIREEKYGKSEDGSQFATILSVLGVSKELDYLNKLTVYQLFNQFERFNLRSQYEQGVKASLAGAPDIELVDWYKKL